MEESREQLPLSRDGNGQVHLMAVGPVKIYVDYQEILGSGGQGTVYGAKVFDDSGTRLLMEVRIIYIEKTYQVPGARYEN